MASHHGPPSVPHPAPLAGHTTPRPTSSEGCSLADPPHILIAGAGYAGLAAYLALRDDLQRGDVAVTVVNADDRHLLLPELPLYLAGESGPDEVRLYLRNAVRSPAKVQVATIERVEPDGPALICKGPVGRLQADGLLVTLGSVSDDFGVPGVKEHTTPIGHWEDMRELRDRLLADLQSKAASSVAVIGGGFTGVEIASELADRARETGSGLKVLLIAPSVLKGMPDSARKTAIDALGTLGVEMIDGRAEAVEAGRVRLKGGRVVEAASIVWAAGVRANPVVGESGLPTNHRGQVHVDACLRAAPRLYMAGDCAEIKDEKTGQSVAPTAQAALQAGPVAARNLFRDLLGKKPEPFEPKDRGFLVSLGHGEAAGRIGTHAVSGGDIAFLKRLIENYHAFQVGGLKAMARRLIGGADSGGPARQEQMATTAAHP